MTGEQFEVRVFAGTTKITCKLRMHIADRIESTCVFGAFLSAWIWAWSLFCMGIGTRERRPLVILLSILIFLGGAVYVGGVVFAAIRGPRPEVFVLDDRGLTYNPGFNSLRLFASQSSWTWRVWRICLGISPPVFIEKDRIIQFDVPANSHVTGVICYTPDQNIAIGYFLSPSQSALLQEQLAGWLANNGKSKEYVLVRRSGEKTVNSFWRSSESESHQEPASMWARQMRQGETLQSLHRLVGLPRGTCATRTGIAGPASAGQSGRLPGALTAQPDGDRRGPESQRLP
jgi:hypothetical protein